MLRVWGSRLHFHVTSGNKGLAKTNSQAQVPAQYISENIQRNVSLPCDCRLSRAIPHLAWWQPRNRSTPFLWCFVLPCSPAPTLLPPLVPHFFITYYVMHTVLHLFKQICNFGNFYYLNLYVFSFITLVIKSKLKSAWERQAKCTGLKFKETMLSWKCFFFSSQVQKCREDAKHLDTFKIFQKNGLVSTIT